MAKVKSQPLDGKKEIATKRTQLSIKYMIDYVAHQTNDDEKKKTFKAFVSSHREELKDEKGNHYKYKYNIKAIRDEFVMVFMPELEKKKEEEIIDPLDLL